MWNNNELPKTQAVTPKILKIIVACMELLRNVRINVCWPRPHQPVLFQYVEMTDDKFHIALHTWSPDSDSETAMPGGNIDWIGIMAHAACMCFWLRLIPRLIGFIDMKISLEHDLCMMPPEIIRVLRAHLQKTQPRASLVLGTPWREILTMFSMRWRISFSPREWMSKRSMPHLTPKIPSIPAPRKVCGSKLDEPSSRQRIRSLPKQNLRLSKIQPACLFNSAPFMTSGACGRASRRAASITPAVRGQRRRAKC
ncbi:hypothetical protein B0H14DRAFT_895508 [Mycena olivaceomarginata]|nr:hypothetical protein B0H14DRAFT_895508 [Mycena olivaceomarginata]